MTHGPSEGQAFLPAVPDALPFVDPSLHGLAHAGPAGGSFLVEGRRALVVGPQAHAGGVVTFPGLGTVVVTFPGLGRAANAVLFPGLARRDFSGRKGITVETLLVAPDLPLVVVSWADAPTSEPITVEIALESSPTSGESRLGARVVERATHGLALSESDAGLAVGVVPGTSRVEVADSGRGAPVRATITPGARGPTALIVAGGERDEVARAFDAAAHLSGHALRAAAGPGEGGLVLHSGISEIDDGVAWARVRLAGLVERHRARPPGTDAHAHDRAALLLGLAAAAVGDREVSARMTALLESRRGADDAPISSAAALLAARHASVFGDAAPAARIARAWATGESTDPTPAPDAPIEEWRLRAFAGRALADALLHSAPAEALAALRRSPGPRPGPSAVPSSNTVRRSLPMAGASSRDPAWADWLEGLFSGTPRPPPPASARADVASLRRAMASFPTDPDAAWSQWRHSLRAGLDSGPAGPATWDDGSGDPLTADILLALAHGLLGLAPDAPAGRLGIAPRMPAHVTTFAVGGISVGSASLRLGYERSGPSHLFTLEPELAAVPPLIVLEPVVVGAVARVLVDGEPANLDVRTVGRHSLVPVHLPLDGPRAVEIITG